MQMSSHNVLLRPRILRCPQARSCFPISDQTASGSSRRRNSFRRNFLHIARKNLLDGSEAEPRRPGKLGTFSFLPSGATGQLRLAWIILD